jgi:hypothetical protein
VFTEDYTFIANNFLDFHEPNCCGQPALASASTPASPGGLTPFATESRGITRISVRELERRGMADLTVADLNKDGWLDTADMTVFMTSGVP